MSWKFLIVITLFNIPSNFFAINSSLLVTLVGAGFLKGIGKGSGTGVVPKSLLSDGWNPVAVKVDEPVLLVNKTFS